MTTGFTRSVVFMILLIIIIVNIGILCYTGVSANSEVVWLVVLLALVAIATCLLP